MEGKGVCFSGAHKIKGKEVEERGRGRGEEKRGEETDPSVEGRSRRVSKGASKRLNRTVT